MDWTKFNNHGESNNHAFEVMCNLLFELWCRETYNDELIQFAFVNGEGGDGGVEAYGTLANGDVVAVQSKWFPKSIKDSQIRQIHDSLGTALNVRPGIKKYIVCIPRDLGSKKIVKGKNVANNTESDRWGKLVSDYKTSNPDVEILLWDETTLQERLTRPETQGIYKYWFENTVIFDNLFNLSYEKAVNSWAKLKYIPEIHTAGYIHNHLEYFLGSIELLNHRFEQICKFISRLENLSRSYKDLLELGIPAEMKELQKNIEKDLLIINKWLKVLENDKEIIRTGGRVKKINESFELNCTVREIKDSPLHSGKYFHFNEAERLLEDIEYDFFDLRRLIEDCDSNKIIFLGNQGTGKTAGIIAEAADFIQTGVHLPVIIHAKEYKEGDTWASMIIKTLGLNSEWNEWELLGALQNAAFIRSHISIESQCVIIVDGIDESTSWKFWKEKIGETITFKNLFPRIKFVFLSRPYVFQECKKLPYRDRFYLLPVTGDGDLEEICDKYFAAYNIDIGENFWIKTNLKTPIAIKLFSDIYRNSTITNLEKNTVVLTELYKAKIKLMEKSYSEKHSEFRGVSVIQIALIELAQLFAEKRFIRYEEIYDKISVRLKNSLNNILNFLTDEGFIYTYMKQEDDFSMPETFYSWGMQPAFDYLIAQKMYKILDSEQALLIDHVDGIYQMLSLISIENGKLITEYNNVELDNQKSFELICYALANCSVSVAGKYTEYLKNLMRDSVDVFREIFNKVIKAVLRTENHPLGSGLLDEFLREFENSAERDIWWSIPAYIRDNYDAEWQTYTEIDFDSIRLKNTDTYNAAPLALVWSLSSVNNAVRQRSRYKLTEWGIDQPLEFWKLFKKCISIEDMQIIEDIFAVSYGIALNQSVCDEYLYSASNWFIENVFDKVGLQKFENVVLRYYASGIVKISIGRGLVGNDTKKLITPPYDYKATCLPLSKKALEAERMTGYKAIDYDLARYVLCDRLDDFFQIDLETKEYHMESKRFIENYKALYGLSEIKIDGLIISIAYQYLLNQGWNPEKFWAYSDKNGLGIDVAIRGRYYYATHGGMSRVMTIAEKNVWLVKHKMEAIFANEMPLCENYSTFQYVNDYSQLENFVNTYQDFTNNRNRSNKHQWFNAELLASPDFEVMDKEKIELWIKDTDEIENFPFNMWLSEHEGNILLNAYTNIQNNMSGVSEAIWISAGAVKKEKFSKMLVVLNNNFPDRKEMLNVCHFNAYQDCKYSCTPQEVCLVHSDREIEGCIQLYGGNEEIEIVKLTQECISSGELDTEKRFMLPSKIARQFSNITYGDGYSYFDKEGRVIARYSCDGENWGTYQSTLTITNDSLQNGLEEYGYEMFWLFRVFREPSPKAIERYKEIKSYSDKTYIVWRIEQEYAYKEILPIEVGENKKEISKIQRMLSFME